MSHGHLVSAGLHEPGSINRRFRHELWRDNNNLSLLLLHFLYFLAEIDGAQTLPKLDECRLVDAAALSTTRVARRISPRRGAHLLLNYSYMHAELRDARENPLSARRAGAKGPLESISNGYNSCLALRSGGAEGANGHRVMQTTRAELLHGMDVLTDDAGVHCGTSTRRRRRSWSPNRADHPIRR